ncbi:PqiC family protein [Thiorhodococcus mannitoliphagus]|uniref:PqiC family protein n=1 Tax=Thiorhodococcus mannitoliphagus TaxID=329406 RepID=UPI0030B8B1DB
MAVSLAGVLVGGCASTPPSNFYTLSSLPATGEGGIIAAEGLGVGLGPVSFPVFLDRPQIVSRETGNRLKVDEFQRWGGTVQDDFLRVWSENLAVLLGTSQIIIFPSEIRYPLDFRVAADVLAFEGTAEGQALLKVRWTVLDAGLDRVLRVREQEYRRPIQAPGDDNAMIAALSATLADFSEDVAETLRRLPRPEPESVQSGL